MATREEDFVTRVFVANTHTPVLFFSNLGRVYKLKVYRLPLATPQSRGKAMVNLLPLADGEIIQTLMPLPENEAGWGELHVMFATAKGYVRRNAMSDFTSVMANGKIAMKFEGEDADDRLVSVLSCSEEDDVLLNARGGKSIRFRLSDVRVFQSRTSVGVRGMKLAGDDEVISMAIIRHVDASPEERRAYLKHAASQRRLVAGEEAELESADEEDEEAVAGDVTLVPERITELSAAEQFILTVTENGFGKRTSALEYRLTNRGGSGIINIDTRRRGDKVVAAFPVEDGDQIMLMTNAGKLIRSPVDDIRIAGRGTAGVTLFRTADGERVVSAVRLSDSTVAAEDEGAPVESGEPSDGEEA
jgi:DNA gyrase subunit A